MRKWNKLLALVLAMVMVFGLTATAFAEANEDEGGTSVTDTSAPAEGEEDNTPDAAPAEGEGEGDDAAPAEGEGEGDDAAPAEGEGDDAAPAEGEGDDAAEPAAVTFSDVAEGQWHYEYIMKMVASKVVEGYEDGTFKPGDSVSWGAAAKMVVVFVTGEEKDRVEGGNWASGYIAYLKDNGIWEDEIDHNAAITRVEMCQLLAKALKVAASEEESTFSDTDDGYVKALVALNVIGGYADGTFKPGDELTRAALCRILASVPDSVKNADAAEPAEGEGEDAAEPTEGEDEDAAEPTEGEDEGAAEPTEGEGEDAAEPAEGEGEGDAEPAEGEPEE